MTGYVYAIADQDGDVKIGWSKAPRTRLLAISTVSKTPLTLIGCVEGTSRDERACHVRFAPWRIRGEWYRRDGDVAEFVASMTPMNICSPDLRQFGAIETPRCKQKTRSNTEAARIIQLLGGGPNVGRLFNVTPNAVSNWACSNRFPSHTFAIMSAELARYDHPVDRSMWGFSQ